MPISFLVGSHTAAPVANTTGANLIVVATSNYTTSAQTVTDNLGNTYTHLPITTGGAWSSRIAYCVNPKVGPGHVIYTLGDYTTWAMSAFSGVASSSPLDKSNTLSSSGAATTIPTTLLLPSADNELVIAAFACNDSSGIFTTVDGGFAVGGTQQPAGAGTYYAARLAHQIQTTATAASPTATLSANSSTRVSSMASFFAAPTLPRTGVSASSTLGPARRSSQPQTATPVQWGNSLSIGLRHLFGDASLRDSVTGLERNDSGSPGNTSRVTTSEGVSLELNTSTGFMQRAAVQRPFRPLSSDFTVAVLVTFLREVDTADTFVASTRGATAATNEWSLAGNYGSISADYRPGFYVCDGSTQVGVSPGSARTLNTPIWVIGRKRGTTVYCDVTYGRARAPFTQVSVGGAPATLATTTRPLELGGGLANAAFNLNGRIHFFGMWSRALSDADLRQLQVNRHQLFAPAQGSRLFTSGALPRTIDSTKHRLAKRTSVMMGTSPQTRIADRAALLVAPKVARSSQPQGAISLNASTELGRAIASGTGSVNVWSAGSTPYQAGRLRDVWTPTGTLTRSTARVGYGIAGNATDSYLLRARTESFDPPWLLLAHFTKSSPFNNGGAAICVGNNQGNTGPFIQIATNGSSTVAGQVRLATGDTVVTLVGPSVTAAGEVFACALYVESQTSVILVVNGIVYTAAPSLALDGSVLLRETVGVRHRSTLDDFSNDVIHTTAAIKLTRTITVDALKSWTLNPSELFDTAPRRIWVGA